MEISNVKYRRVHSANGPDWIILDKTSDLPDFYFHKHGCNICVILNHMDEMKEIEPKIFIASKINELNSQSRYKVLVCPGYNKDTIPYGELLRYLNR